MHMNMCIIINMNIYIRPDREVIIKEFSKKLNKSVSSLIGEFIDDLGKEYNKEVDNLSKQAIDESLEDQLDHEAVKQAVMPMCDKNFCKQRSRGKFKIITDGGENETTLNLCTFHWNQARKEGEVHEA